MSKILLLLLPLVAGLGIRSFLDTLGTTPYSCPPTPGTRNDTLGEFYTKSRPFEGGEKFVIEVPRTFAEFQCGVINRNVSAFLFPWTTPGSRTFFFRSVGVDSELVLMDKFKSIVNIRNMTKFDQTPVNSGIFQYALLLPSGSSSRMGLSNGDPLEVIMPSNTYFGSNLMADDSIGMHT